jgi:hypothetical protein
MRHKRITLAALAALTLAACALLNGPARVTLYAQSLPATIHAQWDPPAAGDNVTGYTMTLDGGAPVNVPNTVDPSCTCIRTPLTVPAFGAHTLNVVAVNLLISGDPSSAQSSTPASVSFTLAKAAVVTGGKVTK